MTWFQRLPTRRSFLSGVAGVALSPPLMALGQRPIPSPALASADDAATGNDLIDSALTALRLYQLPQVAEAKTIARAEFAQRVLGTAEDTRTIDAAVDELAFAAALAAAGSDTLNPRLTFYETMPYRAAGHDIPGGRYGFDNPDRVYRFFFIDPSQAYEIRGTCPPATAPVNILLESCEPKPPGWGYPLTFLLRHAIDIDEDGHFLIIADGAPSNGRRNHLHLPPNANHVLIRETLIDWSKQLPAELSVRRISGNAAPRKSFAAMAEEVAGIVVGYAKNGFLWYDMALAKARHNHAARPQVRPTVPGEKPWGMTATGRYDVQEDEALIITLDLQSAKYLGFLLTSPWMISVDYTRHVSSLNNEQAWRNPDGTITYVIARQDPGVRNWLDTGGLQDGAYLLRWEMVDDTPDPEQGVRETKLVKLRDVPAALPFPMPVVSAAERGQILADRVRGYERRLNFLLRTPAA